VLWGNAKFCSLKGEKGTCDTQYDSDLDNGPYPHDFALDGWVQMNDISNIKIGSAYMIDVANRPGGTIQDKWNSIGEAEQDLMMDSMFYMTGDFKTTAETLIELNNDYYVKWDKKNKNWLGITTSVDLFEEKCTRSTIIVPKDTLFSIRNIPGTDIKNKYLVFWNNAPILYKRTLEPGTNEGSRTQDTPLQSLFVGLLPSANVNRPGGPMPPQIILNGTPLMKSGNTTVFKEAIKPQDYLLTGTTENWMSCKSYKITISKGAYMSYGPVVEFKASDIIGYGTESYVGTWGWYGGSVPYVEYKCNKVVSVYDPDTDSFIDQVQTVCRAASNTCTPITKSVKNYTEENLNQSTKYRLCASRQCSWSWPSNPLGVITGCDGKSGWNYINN
jgi:hypothetical protein